MTQFATNGEFDLNIVQGFTTNTSVSSEGTGQSAEDVMYAYLEAWRNVDFKAMGSLMTEQFRREGHEDPGDGDSINMSDEDPDEGVKTMDQLERMAIEEKVRERRKQSLLVSSEYVGDEFHFRLITPGSKLLSITDQGMPLFCCISIHQIKMQRENNMWRVYDAMTSIERAMSEGPAANMGRGAYDNSEIPTEIRVVQHQSSDGIPNETIEAMKQLKPRSVESFREMQSQAAAITGEYVGDEVHFRLRMPVPKMPDDGEQRMEMSVTPPPDTVILGSFMVNSNNK